MSYDHEVRSKTPGIISFRTKTPALASFRSKTPGIPSFRCKTPGFSSLRSKTPGIISIKSINQDKMDTDITIIDESTEVIIGPDNDWAQITIPGLSASHFTKKGTLNVTEIHNLMLTGMWAIGRHSYFPGYHRLMGQSNCKNLFLVCSDVHISKLFHEETKHQFINLPMDFMEYRHRVNESSYSMERALLDHNTSAIFAAGTDTYVTVGAKSNGPVTLPPEFRKRFKSVKERKDKNDKRKKASTGRYIQLPLPEKTYQYKLRVAPSDCEVNEVTGSRGYSRFIMDCAVSAAKDGFYGETIFSDIYGLEVSRQSLVFVGRSKVGQELLVHTWIDPDKQDTLNFQILHATGDGKTVIHGLTCFHVQNL